jgi:hypothetical protein
MGHLEVVGLEGTSISRLVLATLAVRKLNLFIYLFIWLRRAGKGRTVMDRVTKFRVHDMWRITGFIA